MAKKDKAEQAGKKGGLVAFMIMAVFLLVLGIVFLPSAIIVMAGMVPTLVAAFTARGDRKTRALTVGAMNFAGCTPFLFNLWGAGQTLSHALTMVTDPRTIVMIYCAAGVGYIIDWAMAGIVQTIMVQRAGLRQKDIAKRQAELVARWGPEVTGELTLDQFGFPREAVKTDMSS